MFTQLNQYRVVLEVMPEFQKGPQALQSLYVRRPSGGQVPLNVFTQVERDHRAAGHQPPGTIPRRHPLVQSGAGHFARRRCRGDRAGHGAHRTAREHSGQLSGHGASLPGLAGQRAAADLWRRS